MSSGKVLDEMVDVIRQVDKRLKAFEHIRSKIAQCSTDNELQEAFRNEISKLQGLREKIKKFQKFNEILDQNSSKYRDRLALCRRNIDLALKQQQKRQHVKEGFQKSKEIKEQLKVVLHRKSRKMYEIKRKEETEMKRKDSSSSQHNMQSKNKQDADAIQWLKTCLTHLKKSLSLYSLKLHKPANTSDQSRRFRSLVWDHKFHLCKLKVLMDKINKNQLKSSEVWSIKDDVEQYIQRHMLDDYVRNPTLYDKFKLDKATISYLIHDERNWIQTKSGEADITNAPNQHSLESLDSTADNIIFDSSGACRKSTVVAPQNALQNSGAINTMDIQSQVDLQMYWERILKGKQSQNKNAMQNKAVAKKPLKKPPKLSSKLSSVSTRPSAISPQVAPDTLPHRHRATETIQSAAKKRGRKNRSREEEHHEVDRAAGISRHSPPVKKRRQEQGIRSAEICNNEGLDSTNTLMQNMDKSAKSNIPEQFNSLNPEHNSKSLEFSGSTLQDFINWAAEQKAIEAVSGNKSSTKFTVEVQVPDSNDSESGADTAEYNESSHPDYPALSSDDILRESSQTPSISVAPQQAEIEKVLRHMTPAQTSPQPEQQINKSMEDDLDAHGSILVTQPIGLFDETRNKQLLTKLGLPHDNDKIAVVFNWLANPIERSASNQQFQTSNTLSPSAIVAAVARRKMLSSNKIYTPTQDEVTEIKRWLKIHRHVHLCHAAMKEAEVKALNGRYFTQLAIRAVHQSLLHDTEMREVYKVHPNAFPLTSDQKKKLDEVLRECGTDFNAALRLMKQKHHIKHVSISQVRYRWYVKTPEQTRIEILKAIEEVAP